MSLESKISRMFRSPLAGARPPPLSPSEMGELDEAVRAQAPDVATSLHDAASEHVDEAGADDAVTPSIVASIIGAAKTSERRNVIASACAVCREQLAGDGAANVGRLPGCGHAMHMTCYAQLVRQNRARCTLCPSPALDQESAEQLGGFAIDVGHDADMRASVAQALEYRRVTVRDALIADAHSRAGTAASARRTPSHSRARARAW